METTKNNPQASEEIYWEELMMEAYHKYNKGTDEFLQDLGK
jgi:hypothetical protein